MNRRKFLTTIASTATLGALSASSASAQDGDNQTKTTTPEPETDTVVREIDGNTRVTDWYYQDGAFTVTLESDTVSTVTLSEQIGADSEGSGRFGIRQVRVTNSNPVETTIPAEKVDSKAVITLVTSASINQGYGIYLQAGNGFELFNGESTWMLTAVAAAAGGSGVGYGHKKYFEKNAREQDERQMEDL